MFDIIPHSFKIVFYLGLGISLYTIFEQQCERSNKINLEVVNPILSLLMVIWGSSGFFFLRFLSLRLPDWLNPFLQLLYTAIPDWDILLHSWTKYSWLDHPSWLFSSIVLPTSLIVTTLFSSKRRKHLLKKDKSHSKHLFSLSIGLYIGIAAHLIADLVLFWMPGGDNYNFFVGRGEQYPIIWLTWLLFNIGLGFIIPFLLIKNINFHAHSKSI